MKLKIKENHAGVMTLNDGTKVNYGTIRVNQNMSKLIYYTGKGLREIFKPNMTEDEKHKAEELNGKRTGIVSVKRPCFFC